MPTTTKQPANTVSTQTNELDLSSQTKKAMKDNSKKNTAVATIVQQNNFMGVKSKSLAEFVNTFKDRIQAALPKHMTPERLIEMAVTLMSDPASRLKECTPPSFVGALMQASILGFSPLPVLGHCYFIPYNNSKIGQPECQFQIGYKGFKQLARRSGLILDTYAETVYSNDEYHYELGLQRDVIHRPKRNQNRGEFECAYAIVRHKGGGHNQVQVTAEEVEKYRLRNSGQRADKRAGAWDTDFDAMARKTAFKRLIPDLPISDEFMTAQLADDKVVSFDPEKSNRIETADVEIVPDAA
jgi:recombination protein RecT